MIERPSREEDRSDDRDERTLDEIADRLREMQAELNARVPLHGEGERQAPTPEP